MIPRFVLTIDGVPEFDRAFSRIEKEIDDHRFLWPAVSQEIYQIETEQFETEGGAGASGRWAALSASYKKFKDVAFPNQPILRATTSLFDSVTDPDASGAIFRPEQGMLTIGTSHEAGIDHQRGTGKMPARKVYSFSDTQKRRIQKAIQIGLVQLVRRQGFTVIEGAA
jgi:hypothetical protein